MKLAAQGSARLLYLKMSEQSLTRCSFAHLRVQTGTAQARHHDWRLLQDRAAVFRRLHQQHPVPNFISSGL